MKFRVPAIAAAAALLAAASLMLPVLPEENTAKALLNSTHRHREWVSVRAGASSSLAFVV